MSTVTEKYPLPATCVPMYPDNKSYMNMFGGMILFEGDGWQQESLSWKESCYIHSGLSPWQEVTFSGPDAQKLLSLCSINDVYNWPIHKCKHLVMCDEQGRVANHALTIRDAEDSFRMLAGIPWPNYVLHQHPELDVTESFREIFVFQMGGPLSLTVLEAATGNDLHDLAFLETRPVRIEGFDEQFEVCRIGMAGTLAVELRGPREVIQEAYDLVYQAGLPYGIKRLGWRTYGVNHTEGGFAQYNGTFTAAGIKDPGYMAAFGFTIVPLMTGSIDPADINARLRTPEECGWQWMAKFDHGFIGREAVEAAGANPTKKIVTLKWNAEDFADIFASFVRDGEPYKMFDFPMGQIDAAGGLADLVTKDGKQVGVASDPVYSRYYHAVLAQCTIDADQAYEGNEVVTHWGDFGGPIKEIRATVERYPYIDLEDNRTYDLSKVPSGLK